MMKFITALIVLLYAGTASASGYGGYGHYNHYRNYAQKIVIQETVIPLYDTLVITPHNQFFKTVPDPQITQIIKIERLIEPQNYLVQRLEYAINDAVVVEKSVVPYIQRQSINKYRQYCR
jgi:hypothetical protein